MANRKFTDYTEITNAPGTDLLLVGSTANGIRTVKINNLFNDFGSGSTYTDATPTPSETVTVYSSNCKVGNTIRFVSADFSITGGYAADSNLFVLPFVSNGTQYFPAFDSTSGETVWLYAKDGVIKSGMPLNAQHRFMFTTVIN